MRDRDRVGNGVVVSGAVGCSLPSAGLALGSVLLGAAFLREAVRVGVKRFFIEDESPTVLEQIPESVRFLESLQW